MASNTGRLGKLSFIKEAAWGTYLTPDKALSVTAESLMNKLSHVEDGRFIGEIMQSDMILVGQEIEGGLEVTAHPKEIGPLLFQALMKDASPATSPVAMLLISYTGSNAYASLTMATDVLTGKSGATQGTAVQDWTFDTTSASYDTLTELAAAINLVSDWNAYVIGAGTSDPADIADFTEAQLRGVYVAQVVSASSSTKIHHVTPAAATDTEPSMSICVDRTLGTAQAFGLAGVKVNSLNLNVESRQIVKMSLNVSGKVESTGITYPTITLTQDKPFVSSLVSLFVDGVQVDSFKNFSLAINNNLSKDGQIGSDYIQEQIRQGVTAVFSGTLNLVSSEFLADYPDVTGDTTKEILIVLEHAEYADATNLVKYLAFIRLPAVKFTKWGPPFLSGPNRLTVEVNGNAVNSLYYDNVDVWVVDAATSAY